MTNIKRIHTCLTAHMTSILKYAVLALSLTLSATLQAKSINDNTQIQCIAQTAYHEARSEGEKGMMATIFVVLNRTKDNRFPSTPCKVIAQKNQFAWYGKGKTIKELEMYDKAKNNGFQFVTRNLVSYIKNERLAEQSVVVGTGYNVIKVYENGMLENNY